MFQPLFNGNVPEMSGHLVDAYADSVFFVIFHLLGPTGNFIKKKKFNNILKMAQLVTHLNSINQPIYPHFLNFSPSF